LKHTEAGNESSVKVTRYPTYIPKDVQKNSKELSLKLKRLSTGNFDLKAGADLKVVAIYLSHASVLQKIASQVTNTSEDFKKVYFVLEDDVSFGGGPLKISDWADQVMCHISKLPPDWDIYKFGAWGESLGRRKDDSCGHAHPFNEHSCQLKLLQGEDQWEWMGNMGFAIRPRGARAMLNYLRTKQVMDVDGAYLPTSWSNMRYAPNYYHSRSNLVWHKSPNNGRSGFIEREHTQTSNEKTNFLKEGIPKRLRKGQMEVWYVNLDESKQRSQCVEGQLKKQFIEPKRFSAVQYPTKCEQTRGSPANKNCFKKMFADCMEGGINWAAVSSHGTTGAAAGSVQKGVIANWCSHKRILDLFAKDNKTAEEKYYVILEDDVIISPKFRLALENFIASYPGQWKYIQVDPFGAEGRQVAFHNGRVTEPGKKGEKFPGDNYGMHCLVVKQSEIETLQKYFTTHEVIPIDWIAKDIPGMITWAGNIAQNPEGHNGFEFQKPSFCQDGIYKSNIAGETEDKQKKKK
jgi:GR25 family glycosyltransferase involved in LPS biosynthesis